MRLEVPKPLTTFEVALDDAALIKVRRHGNPNGPRLFLSHGNGFAINAYLPYWRLFIDRYDVILFDFRNHGENLPVTTSNHHSAQLSRALERGWQGVTDAFGPRKSAGIFHSMSGRAAMKHAIEIGRRWDALILFDPPNVPPPDHPAFAAMQAFEARLVAFAKLRRTHCGAMEDLAADFTKSRAGQGWVAGAHELMTRSILRKNPAGEGYVLVCDP